MLITRCVWRRRTELRRVTVKRNVNPFFIKAGFWHATKVNYFLCCDLSSLSVQFPIPGTQATFFADLWHIKSNAGVDQDGKEHSVQYTELRYCCIICAKRILALNHLGSCWNFWIVAYYYTIAASLLIYFDHRFFISWNTTCTRRKLDEHSGDD